MMITRSVALSAAILGLAAALGSVPATAQTSAPTAAPATPAPKTDLDAKPGTLSDKLSDTGGVIKPTGDVDPAMHKAAPQTGSMPLIRPGEISPGTAK